MSAAAGGSTRVRIDADLLVEIDGLPAHVTGDGDVVRVVTDRPLALMRSLGAVSVPGSVGQSLPVWGARLAQHDVRLELSSPRGLVGALGAGSASTVESRTSRRWHVEPGRVDVVLAEGALEVGGAVRKRRVAIVTVVVVIALVLGARPLRHHLRGN